MKLFVTLLAGFALAGPLRAADEPAKPNTLTPQEIADGWLLLFDGETTFGWKVEGDARIKDGVLTCGGDKEVSLTTTAQFTDFELSFDFPRDSNAKISAHDFFQYLNSSGAPMAGGRWLTFQLKVWPDASQRRYEYVVSDRAAGRGWTTGPDPWFIKEAIQTPIRITVPAGGQLSLRDVKLKPLNTRPLFNGKDLAGWRVYSGDPNRQKSRFTVTPEGWLNVKDGPGDLQTEGQWADFVLQLECISHGKHLNSGLFFRCLPKQYQQGYEAQIRNEWQGEDRTKPVDFGTGAIYRRQPARKVVSSDGEWFTLTIVAHGNHLATWVNGYQVTDWTDPRPANDNARNGAKTGPGCLSIQGHDPTTDLSFRNIRIAELAAEKK
jgi:hypothetical protein